jgi:ribonuclease BN (tRNA processing enzyme)
MAPASARVRVWVLGSGDAFGTGGRLQSGYLVEAGSATFLLDCGATILPALKRHGRDTGSIDAIFISHLHGDHFGGLPFLFLEYLYENVRTRPLLVAGPPGLEERVRAVFGALYREPAAMPPPYPLEFVELHPGRSATFGGVDVRPFRVPHQTASISLGLRVSVDGRHILYSGDSAWCEDFVAQSAGTDLFLCESFLFDTPVDYHMNYCEIAANTARLGCRRLVLSHLGRELLDHRAEVALECAEDGTVVEL